MWGKSIGQRNGGFPSERVSNTDRDVLFEVSLTKQRFCRWFEMGWGSCDVTITISVLWNVLFDQLKGKHAWWRHQMETFSALLALCAGNSPVPGEFPTQRPVTRSFDIFFDLRLNEQLSKQSCGWWFETLSRPFWRHCNRTFKTHYLVTAPIILICLCSLNTS